MDIPLYSSTIMRREMDAVLTCMVSEKIGPGEINRKLSQTAREIFGADAALPLRSGSVALRYVLQALDLPPGSGVILSALSPAWHYKCLLQMGYTPVLADPDPETAQLTPESVRDAAVRGGKVLLLFDALGYLPDVRGILELNLPVIEDISQSAGAYYGAEELSSASAPAGGDTASPAAASAAPAPEIPASAYAAGSGALFSILGLEERDLLTAGGGAILLAPKRREGIIVRRMFEEAPVPDVLSDMNSALALVQLKEMQHNHGKRAAIHSVFLQALLQARAARHKTLAQTGGGVPSFYSFPVALASSANDARQYAAKQGIRTGAAFADSVAALLGDGLEGCRNARSLLLRCLLFPLYPRLGSKNVEKIAKVLRSLP